MIIWNSSFFPALYSSCSELNHKKIQYCSSSGLSRLCSSFLDLSNFLISGKSSNEKKPETRNSWNEEFPETRKILKRGISWNEEILSHHRLLCFITNIKRNTAGLSATFLLTFTFIRCIHFFLTLFFPPPLTLLPRNNFLVGIFQFLSHTVTATAWIARC